MWVCLCNSFNDKAVKDAIQTFAPDRMIERKDIRALYKLCSGGVDPNCGKCLRTVFVEMVDAHNEAIAQKTNPQKGNNGVQIATPANDMTPPAGAGGCGNCQCDKGGPRCIPG
ncbi:hypothetical protein [Micavibrio aeruginosavorus]|uniref:BFD-like [2Fe-2S]-binding domain-containing protein n=1 Tax=Micavibrio aeruginosavorus (strain ARL-13) TaxID=856793 RepID=G2KSV1_MICAA|nr:hypothetical protein [Micavibrio aeruginosavorus]AEP10096.1 hypothetical protein MICA_1785 [Micavibrio aeruginosavorus ARL-13]